MGRSCQESVSLSEPCPKYLRVYDMSTEMPVMETLSLDSPGTTSVAESAIATVTSKGGRPINSTGYRTMDDSAPPGMPIHPADFASPPAYLQERKLFGCSPSLRQ